MIAPPINPRCENCGRRILIGRIYYAWVFSTFELHYDRKECVEAFTDGEVQVPDPEIVTRIYSYLPPLR